MTTVSISDAAHEAWALKAQSASQAARHSFTTQLWQKIRVPRDSYEVDPTFFPEEFDPVASIGAVIDGLTFCLNDQRQLSVVSWRCAQKGCHVIIRGPFTDLSTLGRELAAGEQYRTKYPKCKEHAGRRPAK